MCVCVDHMLYECSFSNQVGYDLCTFTIHTFIKFRQRDKKSRHVHIKNLDKCALCYYVCNSYVHKSFQSINKYLIIHIKKKKESVLLESTEAESER